MATLIRATCEECGDVELGTTDLLVRMCQDADIGTYVFQCPGCDTPVVRSAERRVLDLLVTSGVRLEMWTLPSELNEWRPVGAPFTHDDLIDFHELLSSPTWFRRLLAAPARRERQL